MKKADSFSKLVWLMAKLRSKTGCPWDRVQTHKSLKPYLVEETCEVLDAINKKNPKMLMDELGDLLYQVIFHAEIAKERKQFDINDVIENSYAKLKHRHPHVFGKQKIRGAENVITSWHKFKLKEARKRSKKHSVVSNIPHVLPALQKAGKVQRKVAVVGFDWKHIHDIINKVDEELGEVKDAIKKGKPSYIREEIGDLLFAIVNLSRFFGIESEHALHETINKFIARFQKIEKLLKRKGKNIEECSLPEMEKAWNEVKKK